MVRHEEILDAVDRIVAKFAVSRIILFGSYACGSANVDSDVDLLIITDQMGAAHRLATRIRALLDVSWPLDLIVRRPSELESARSQNDFFLGDILATGIVLHAHNDTRMAEEGRRRLRRLLASAKVPKAQPV